MGFAGNEHALRCNAGPSSNRVDLSEYPCALPLRPGSNFTEFFPDWRKYGDFAGRPNIDPESALLRTKEFCDNPAPAPIYLDLFSHDASGHDCPHCASRTRADASTSSTMPS